MSLETGLGGKKVNDAWPVDGLENVETCPVCGSTSRTLIYEGLHDRVFFCAPGEWKLYRCVICRSGYIDPRPTPETLHLAYRNYFTHEVYSKPSRSLSKPFTRIFANGYRNWRYGTHTKPSSWLGILVKGVQPGRRAGIDAEMRHLPRPWPGARILDLGCGNGEFLAWAQDMGWQVEGVDPDPAAVAMARARGVPNLRVGGIETLGPSECCFDAITLNHVIEHLYDPFEVLRICYRLLRPAGFIWIETPNLDSLGHAQYGIDWRGLEPPRHLVLFTRQSLQIALERAGFFDIQDMPFRPECAGIFASSEAIARGGDPRYAKRMSYDVRKRARKADRLESREPSRREFVTIRAKKGNHESANSR